MEFDHRLVVVSAQNLWEPRPPHNGGLIKIPGCILCARERRSTRGPLPRVRSGPGAKGDTGPRDYFGNIIEPHVYTYYTPTQLEPNFDRPLAMVTIFLFCFVLFKKREYLTVNDRCPVVELKVFGLTR